MTTTLSNLAQSFAPLLAPSDSGCSELRAGEENEVLAFLAERPIHSVFISSLIRDNGLASPHNRGTFYAFRNRAGKFDGVALIGHATIVETRGTDPGSVPASSGSEHGGVRACALFLEDELDWGALITVIRELAALPPGTH